MWLYVTPLLLLLLWLHGSPVCHAMDFFNKNSFQSQQPPSGRADGSGSSSDFYSRLQVDRKASDSEVKKAYRKQAMIMHPDKGGDTEQFKLLTEAYEVLSDPKKRALYDKYGKDGLSQRAGMDFGGNSNQFPADFGDLFGSFSNSFRMPLMYTIELSLEDLFTGRELQVSVNSQQIVIVIEPGMFEGVELRGDISDSSSRDGSREIVFVVNEKPHPFFKRLHADLCIELDVSLREALLGFERVITHLDGASFTVRSCDDEVYSPDDVLVIDDMGMPFYSPDGGGRSTGRGKLFMKLVVHFPGKTMKLSEEDRAALDRLLPADSDEAASSKSKGGYVNKKSRRSSSSSRQQTGAAAVTLQPKKSSLKHFGASGRQKRSSRPADDPFHGNFGPFFFR